MSTTGGGLIILKQMQKRLDSGGKSLVIDNQSTTLDLSMTDDQANSAVAAFGSSSDAGDPIVMAWGSGT